MASFGVAVRKSLSAGSVSDISNGVTVMTRSHISPRCSTLAVRSACSMISTDDSPVTISKRNVWVRLSLISSIRFSIVGINYVSIKPNRVKAAPTPR